MLFGQRFRAFYLSFVLGLWLFMIDGIYYAADIQGSYKSHQWSIILLIILGFIFGIVAMVASIFILIWARPELASMVLMIVTIVCCILRLICTVFGFDGLTTAPSFSSNVTDLAIALLQILLISEAINVYRTAKTEVEMPHH